MKADVQAAYNTVKNATREQLSLVQFWADGVGTWTPPGHWDYIAAQDFIGQNYSEVRWARNMALLNMAEMDAGIVCCVPNFPSYVSGHAMFSSAAAAILGYLIPARAQAYATMAQQAADSRVWSGIHYSIDCTTGATVGQNVGNYAVQRAMIDGADQ